MQKNGTLEAVQRRYSTLEVTKTVHDWVQSGTEEIDTRYTRGTKGTE